MGTTETREGVTVNMYAQLTDAELAVLEITIYSGCLHLFNASSASFERAGLVRQPARDEIVRTAHLQLTAGRELSELHREIRAEQRDRDHARAMANAAAVLADGARIVAAVDAAMTVVESRA